VQAFLAWTGPHTSDIVEQTAELMTNRHPLHVLVFVDPVPEQQHKQREACVQLESQSDNTQADSTICHNQHIHYITASRTDVTSNSLHARF